MDNTIKIQEFSDQKIGSPAVFVVSGNKITIKINAYYARKYTPAELLFLILHELAHYYLDIGNGINNEMQADEWALDQMFLAIPPEQDIFSPAISALKKMKNISNKVTAERIENLKSYSQKLKQLDAYLKLEKGEDAELNEFHESLIKGQTVNEEQMAIFLNYTANLYNKLNPTKMNNDKQNKPLNIKNTTL